MQYYTGKTQGTSFREIVLGHIKKILEISTEEFKGGFFIEKEKGGFVEKTYVQDTRKRYIQSIESLSDVLQPYFGKEMKEEHKKIELELLKNLNEYKKTNSPIGSLPHDTFVTKKLEIMRKFFQKINFQLKDLDYLKGRDYSETGVLGDDEDNEDDDDEAEDS